MEIALHTRVADLLVGVNLLGVVGEMPTSISGLTADSRKVVQGGCFVALVGTSSDGHDYVDKAVAAGASLVIHQRDLEHYAEGVAYLKVADSAEVFGCLAANLYGNPSKHLQLVGVTGTNGKTSVATLLYRLLTLMGERVGLISTVENRILDLVLPTQFTTPAPLELQELLAKMVAAGCRYAFMEVSSHALAQQRVAGVHFAGGIFTNLTRDHLDYHGSFQAYRDAKKSFFDHLPANSFALSNADDPNGAFMLQNCKARKEYYSLSNFAYVRCELLSQELEGMLLRLNGTELYLPLLGRFNAYNIAAVYGAALLLGCESTEVLRLLTLLRPVRGRLQYMNIAGRVGVVDFAHTPDAIEKVLDTLADILPSNASIIGVIGAGGDRDQGKRPLMAAAAIKRCNKLILTSDNPRHEVPEVIIEQMYEGIPLEARGRVLKNVDRREAIRTAVSLSKTKDFILVAGKGHEAYQQIGDQKFPFDDATELQQALELIAPESITNGQTR